MNATRLSVPPAQHGHTFDIRGMAHYKLLGLSAAQRLSLGMGGPKTPSEFEARDNSGIRGTIAMAKTHLTAVGIALSVTLSLGACAGGGDLFGNTPTTTSALPEKPRTDPACALLAGKMAELRKDGVVERTEQAAQGKGSTVSVKRESLAKLTELNKANVEFQGKCSTYKPVPSNVAQTAPAPQPPAALTKAAAAAKTAAVSTAKAKAKETMPPAVADAAAKVEPKAE